MAQPETSQIEREPGPLNPKDIIQIFTESFALSQGEPNLQNLLFHWATLCYSNRGIKEAFSQTNQTEAVMTPVHLVSTLVKHENHKRNIDMLHTTSKEMWEEFKKTLASSGKEGFEKDSSKLAATILFGMIRRDKKFIDEGRNRSNSDEEVQSFLINFVILQKNSGVYTYNRFAKFWKPLFEEMRTILSTPEKFPPAVADFVTRFIENWKRNTNTSPEDIDAVEAFLSKPET